MMTARRALVAALVADAVGITALTFLIATATPAHPRLCTWTFTDATWQVTSPAGEPPADCVAPGAPGPDFTTPPDRYALNRTGGVALYVAVDQRAGWTAAQRQGHGRYGGPLVFDRVEVA